MAPLDPKNTYIMALDGDVAFKPEAVRLVLNRLERHMDVAAACNQIKPSGNGWLVWFQRFEYAVGHWLQKTTEHVLGCVLCSPGCFSIIRCSFLSKEVFEEPAPIDIYKSHAKSPRQKLMYDQVIYRTNFRIVKFFVRVRIDGCVLESFWQVVALNSKVAQTATHLPRRI